MPSFRVKALGMTGERRDSVIEAADGAAALRQARAQGLLPIEAAPVGTGGRGRGLSIEFGGRRSLKRDALVAATREIATLLAAGESLDRALRFAAETASSRRVRTVLGTVRDRVRSGAALSAALAGDTGAFPDLYVAMVRAGEAGGMLAETLDRLAEMLEAEQALAATIVSALIYPAMLLLAAIGTIVLLVTYVLPQFVPMFQENGVKVPASTQFLLDAGAFLNDWGMLILILIGITALAAPRVLALPAVRLALDRTLLSLPVLGGLARDVAAARFCRVLGTLLDNGAALVGGLAITRDVIGNRVIAQTIGRAIDAVRGGAGLAPTLAAHAVFPVRALHLIRLGEESGRLATVLLRAARIQEQRVGLVTQRLVALIVPAITLAMGVMVAAIIGTLLGSLMSLNDLAG